MVLGVARFIGFLPSTDLDRSRDFYERLGLACIESSPPRNVHDANGTQLWVTLVDELTPQPFTVAGWHVPDIGSTLEALRTVGVEPKMYDGFGQDNRGVWRTPSGSQVVWFDDPDGNNLSVTQLG
jgi:catechol 2,3-dioxygenase-like lactoylglutathione lyase family enzyme